MRAARRWAGGRYPDQQRRLLAAAEGRGDGGVLGRGVRPEFQLGAAGDRAHRAGHEGSRLRPHRQHHRRAVWQGHQWRGAIQAALLSWSRALAFQLPRHGITVNCVAPGRINSVQILERLHPTRSRAPHSFATNIPIGRFGEPTELGKLGGVPRLAAGKLRQRRAHPGRRRCQCGSRFERRTSPLRLSCAQRGE
jgi:NAD(P)-dependent dehydrogenase (short-subunit alcohol dehydrogenase family)